MFIFDCFDCLFVGFVHEKMFGKSKSWFTCNCKVLENIKYVKVLMAKHLLLCMYLS